MAKGKDKDDAPNPNNVPNRDIMQRMNFLYQAAIHLTEIASLPPAPKPSRHSNSHQSAVADEGLASVSNENDNASGDGDDTDGPPGDQGHAAHATNIRPNKSSKAVVELPSLVQVYGESMRDIGLKTNVRM